MGGEWCPLIPPDIYNILGFYVKWYLCVVGRWSAIGESRCPRSLCGFTVDTDEMYAGWRIEGIKGSGDQRADECLPRLGTFRQINERQTTPTAPHHVGHERGWVVIRRDSGPPVRMAEYGVQRSHQASPVIPNTPASLHSASRISLACSTISPTVLWSRSSSSPTSRRLRPSITTAT